MCARAVFALVVFTAAVRTLQTSVEAVKTNHTESIKTAPITLPSPAAAVKVLSVPTRAVTTTTDDDVVVKHVVGPPDVHINEVHTCPICSNTVITIPAPVVIPTPKDVRINPLFRHLLDVGEIDTVWSWFLARHPNAKSQTVVEIGSYDCTQALDAARKGFNVIAMEPSPKSFKTCTEALARDAVAAKNIQLLQVAASDKNGEVTFNAGGGTGDHVGHNPGEVMPIFHSGEGKVQVPSMRGDQLLAEKLAHDKSVYLMKIDTQGYDPFVVDGLHDTLVAKRIMYLIIEFWPAAVKGAHGRNAGDMLMFLHRCGYTLFDSRMLWLKGWSPTPIDPAVDFVRPTQDSDAYTQYYLDRDARDADKFGSWTDIIAVADVRDLNTFFFPK